MKRVFYVLAILGTFIFGITFALKNKQDIELSYYFGLHWTGPVTLALLGTLALGVVIGFLAGLRTVLRMQRSLVKARKEIRQIEQEVINLRALPIKDVL